MPPNPKPTPDDSRWASDETNLATILSGQKTTGWLPGNKPPAQILNRLFFEAYKWWLWLETLFDGRGYDTSALAFPEPRMTVKANGDAYFLVWEEWADESGAISHTRWYKAGIGSLHAGACVRTYNAKWSERDGIWAYDDDGDDAIRHDFWPGGFEVLTHPAGMDEWADTIGAGEWTRRATLAGAHGLEAVGASGSSGVYATGTGAPGVQAFGGTNQPGVQATGDGSGPGVKAFAGTSGAGVDATGGNSSAAVKATGSAGAAAITATGGTNKRGIEATGNGTAAGGQFTGGATAPGIEASGGNGVAFAGTGDITATGGVTGGTGVTSTTGDVTATTGNARARHFVGLTSAPSISVNANAGSGAAGTVTGHDSSGYIQIATGTGTSTGDQAVITFNVSYGSAPVLVMITPKNQAAINLFATTNKNINVSSWSATTFTLSTIGATALVASTTYEWWYKVEG